MSTGLSAFLRLERLGVLAHWCPGCRAPHRLNTSSTDHPLGKRWHFNGNYRRPTFEPRVELPGCSYCLVDGWLHFDLSCSHDLAGQSVQLPAYPFTQP